MTFRFGLLLVLLVAALLVSAAPTTAEWCQTVMVPESDGTGGQIIYPRTDNLPGQFTYLIRYPHPVTATRVGLEFWHHVLPWDAPSPSVWLLAYINRADKPARRLFAAANVGPEAGTGWPVNFPMSTWLHPGEEFVVTMVNLSGADRQGYLIVAVRECYP